MARQGSPPLRDGRALLLAASIHALSLFAVRHWARQPAPPELAAPAPAASEELDITLEATEPAREVALTGPAKANTEYARSVAHSPPRPTAAIAMREATPSEPSAAPADASELTTTEPDAASEPTQPIDLGIGAEGWRRWALNSAPADGAPATRDQRRALFHAPPASSTGGLQEGLEEHDRAVGLTPAGRVRSALFHAAHSDIAPQLGFASFRVTVLNDGAVEVALNNASSAEKGWQAVAERAASELRQDPPRIPPPRSGTRMIVEIRAEAVMPNGAKVAELHGPRLEVDPPRIRTRKQSEDALRDKNPTAETFSEPGHEIAIAADLPGVYVSHAGKVCKVRAGVTPLGLVIAGGCDPSNIGVKPQRMVHTRVRDESLF